MKKVRITPAIRAAKRRSQRVPESLNGKAAVNPERLASYNSYGDPEFVTRGYYQDKAFRCCDCGKEQLWTASQQKWWHEVAKGDVFTQAKRCRECRRRERERRNEARRIHLDGLATKRPKS